MAFFKFDANLKAIQMRQIKIARERDIQRSCEKNLEVLLGVRFLASEYGTGAKHAGRIDSLGIDQNSCPVILEYKKHESENVITQGLYYLDWLLDHRGDFEALVRKILGDSIRVDWTSPRLVLIAEGFNKFDVHAISKIPHRIELKIYRWYDGGFLQLEDYHGASPTTHHLQTRKQSLLGMGKAIFNLEHHLRGKPASIQNHFSELREQILLLPGSESIREQVAKQYIAYKTTKNFCEVEVQKSKLKIYLDINKEELDDPRGWAQDCSKVGHWATGNSRFVFPAGESVDYAIGLIKQAHRSNS